jgi:hypothetical protein
MCVLVRSFGGPPRISAAQRARETPRVVADWPHLHFPPTSHYLTDMLIVRTDGFVDPIAMTRCAKPSCRRSTFWNSMARICDRCRWASEGALGEAPGSRAARD